MAKLAFIAMSIAAMAACGCADSAGQGTAAQPAKKGIFGKTTQEIGKFDPNARQVVSDQSINATDPITAPLAAYGPTIERIAIIELDHAVQIFEAIEGRYPKNYDEFMEKVVKANNIRLPVLPYGAKYQYDEKNHALVVVKPPPEQPAAPKEPAR